MATRPCPMVTQRLVRMLIGTHAIDLINIGAHAIVLINIGAHAIELINFGYHAIHLYIFIQQILANRPYQQIVSRVHIMFRSEKRIIFSYFQLFSVINDNTNAICYVVTVTK